jgi:UDP-N-acetyl-D-mannosaminuronic acid dehydrogenase
MLERELADVAVCDPHAATPTASLADVLEDADVVIVATNHSEFEGPAILPEIVARASGDCLLVDPWNALGSAQVFVSATDAAAPAEGSLARATPIEAPGIVSRVPKHSREAN